MNPAAPRIWAMRLHPGDDLKKSLQVFATEHAILAGYIITCTGSLTECNLRLAADGGAFTARGKFEILSVTGTIADNGLHLHIALADLTGKAIGGHLLDGNIIYTTAEIVIGEAQHLLFTRLPDPQTGFPELIVTPREI